MKKIYLFLAFICFSLYAHGQTTVTIYAGGGLPVSDSVTGSVDSATSTRTKDSIASDAIERGYAVFDLSTIPAGATITGVKIGFNVQYYTVVFGTASAWNIRGYAGDLSTVTAPATLWADCGSGTSLYTTSFGSSTGNRLFTSTAPAVTFVSAHIGTKVSMCFSSAGGVRYNITGEVGVADTIGTHAPFIQVTYTMPCSPITGVNHICLGTATTLVDTASGGTWASSNSFVASVIGGVVTGNSLGIAIISYTTSGCTAIDTVTVNDAGTILPSSSVTVCVNQTTTLLDSISGGIWSSTNTGIATVSSSGILTGVAAGIDTVKYTVGACVATALVTVQGPAAISPSSTSICVGGSTTLSDVTSSGTWTVTNSHASIGSTTGVITGLSVGTDTVHYTVGSCFVQSYVTITSGPSSITPSSPVTVCAGTTTTLVDTSAGGTWSSSNTAVATIGATTGLVTAVAPGTTTITYAIGSCTTTKIITVSAAPAAITPATATVCIGGTATLTDATAGGVWSSSSSVATVAGGIVTGASVGTATISYTIGTCSSTALVTVNSGPAAILPATPISICTGATTTLTDATAGGLWTSSSSAIATVAGGVVTGVTVGTVTITYAIGTCFVTKSIGVTAGVSPIAPATASICLGTNITFTNATPGGAWTSGNTAVATIASGFTTGVGAGVTTISYTVGTCTATASISVNASPSPITPATAISICSGTTSTLSDVTAGGVWSSSNNAVATVSATGVVTGIASGSATISYTIAGCSVTKLITVTSAVAAIAPTSGLICIGSNFTFTDATGGGIWTTSDPTVATVSGGVATGIGAGTATISYTSGTCVSTASVTVNAAPAAISPVSSLICEGTNITLTDATAGGVWSSSAAGIASVSAGGVVTGTGPGVATISYSVGSCSATAVVTVSAAPTAISPSSTTVCQGSSISLLESIAGGAWTSADVTVATVSATGLVTGVAVGTTTISYSIGTCTTSATVTVNPLPAVAAISGPNTMCGLSTFTLVDPTVGGIWSASNGNATVSATGVVTGVAPGSDIISYSVSNSCGAATATYSITIDGAANAGTILGPTIICAGSFTLLADSMASGVWTASNSNASVSATGIVTGLTAGAVTITYTVTNACGTAFTTQVMTVLPLPIPGVISGPTSLCVSSTMTLTDPVAGGVWSSSNTTLATISGSGVVTGITAGTDTISYALTNGCGTVAATYPITVIPIPTGGTITGPSSVCVGSLITLVDPSLGGSFSSSNSNATVIPATGVVSGINPGIDTITYTVLNACGIASTNKTITIDALPAPASITGPGLLCLGATATYTDASTGGSWNTTNGNVFISTGGIATALAIGADTITYTLTNSCGSGFSSLIVLVNPLPDAGTITGSSSICISSTGTLADAIAGGTWSISNANASISSSGVVLGVSPGLDTVLYSVTNSCGTATATFPVTVNLFPTAGVISGPSVVCAGATVTLTESLPGGTWSSGDTVATISTTGVVTGVSSGTDTISYTIVNSCGTVGTFKIMTISPLPNPGTISGPSGVCVGSSIALTDAIAGGVWSSGNADATVSGTGLVTGVTAGIDPISYSVTNSCGTVSAIANITVSNTPVTGPITGASSVCAGATITMSNIDTGGVWTISNSNGTISATGVVAGITAGTDTVYYTIANACGTATSNTTISINPTPAMTAISGATSLCAGATTNLTDATAGGTWSSSNTVAGTISASGLLSGVGAGVTTISYSIANAFGCTGLATYSDTVFVVPSASPITGTMAICNGATTTLSDAITTGIWSSTNSTIATVNAATGVVTGVSTGSVLILYSVSNVCGSALDSATVTVSDAPAVAPVSGPASTICSGATTMVSDATPGGVWSSSDITIATVGSTTGIVSGVAAGNVTITYTVTNGSGCSSDATFNITFGSFIGTSYVTPASGTLCHGSSVYMHVITSGSGLTYQWMRNGVAIVGANNYFYNADSAGTYSVLISNGTCEELLSGPTVTMPVAPVITFTAPDVFSTGSYASYQWYRNGIAILGATSSVYIATSAGAYAVVVTDGSGCTDTSAAYNLSGGSGGGGTAVANVNGNSTKISLYPNPATSIIHIDAPFTVNVKVLSPDGKVVADQKETTEINISSLSSGMYIIMIYDQNDLLVKTDKLMKL